MQIRRGDEFFIPYVADDIKIKASAATDGSPRAVSIVLCNPGRVTYDIKA
jgi:hypothetical protein